MSHLLTDEQNRQRVKVAKKLLQCIKLMTKSSSPMSSQVMKIGSIILSQSERLAIKSGPLNIAEMPNNNIQAVFKCKEGLVCKFLWLRSHNKSAGGKGQNHHRKVLQRHNTGEAEKI